ncbi:MAG: phosphatidylglycerophosphatase A [Thermodesulfobacteriota bacterium]
MKVGRRSPGETLALFLSSGCGLGYLPYAPGTFGTLAGVPVVVGLARLPLWAYLTGTVLLTGAAVLLAGRAQALYERHDDPRIVIDEVAGYVVTMAGVPVSAAGLFLGFVMFRVFDIFKPWPCRTIDRRWRTGAGVVLDDVAAGLYALGCLHLLCYLWPRY